MTRKRRSLGDRVIHGASLGLDAARKQPGGRSDGVRTFTNLLRGAAIGALYSATELLLGLPPLETVLKNKRSDDAVARSRKRAALTAQRFHSEGRHEAAPGRDCPETPRKVKFSAASSPAAPRARLDTSHAARALNAGAAALSFSVVADSALEHCRGGFYNKVMYVAPAVSAVTLLATASAVVHPGQSSPIRRAIFAAAAATGAMGTCFHLFNVLKREGGFSWQNVFRSAPVAAPLGITFAGIFGMTATSLGDGRYDDEPLLLGIPTAPLLGSFAAVGLLGTAAEAGLLHFRGAFQDPFMYVPVTVPPLAALALGAAVASPTSMRRGAARALLLSTAAAGVAGMGFHAYGVSRYMGGWYNWSQNLFVAPPLPAPPSFTGMAFAGLAALSLFEERNGEARRAAKRA